MAELYSRTADTDPWSDPETAQLQFRLVVKNTSRGVCSFAGSMSPSHHAEISIIYFVEWPLYGPRAEHPDDGEEPDVDLEISYLDWK